MRGWRRGWRVGRMATRAQRVSALPVPVDPRASISCQRFSKMVVRAASFAVQEKEGSMLTMEPRWKEEVMQKRVRREGGRINSDPLLLLLLLLLVLLLVFFQHSVC